MPTTDNEELDKMIDAAKTRYTWKANQANLNFAGNIRRLREERGWSQRKLAELTGLKHPNISRLEAAENYPTLDTIAKFAQVFGVEIGDLISDFPNHEVERLVREARIDENWLLIKQAHKVADENGGGLRRTKVTLEAIIYWTKDRISVLAPKDRGERNE